MEEFNGGCALWNFYLVHDLSAVDDVLDGVPKLHGGVDKLAECLHPAKDSPDREGDHAGAPRLVGGVHLHLVCKTVNSIL